MIELTILSGKQAGSTVPVRRFPWRIGRAAAADLRLEEEGVWDQHLELEKDCSQGFILRRQPETTATLNGEFFQEAILRNGDIIDAGQVKLQFWLSEPRQRNLWPREVMTWVSMVLLCAFQLGIVYWLTQ